MMSKNPAGRPSYDEIIQTLQTLAAELGAVVPRLSPPSAITPDPSAKSSPTKATLNDLPRRVSGTRTVGDESVHGPRSVEASLALPRWTLPLTILSLTVFLVSLGLYLFLRPVRAVDAPATGAIPVDASSDRGLADSLVRGNVMHIPSLGLIEVAPAPISVAQMKKVAPDLMYLVRPEGENARGLSLEAARDVVRRMGGRLPTTREWYYIEESALSRTVPADCEWVDDGKTPKARCFKGTRAVVRAVDRPYRNSLFRWVRTLEEVHP
jgi:hypothetical protein